MRPKPDFLPRMRGATGSVAGRRGLVPKPAAADNVKYLKGDGSWSALSNASAATDAEAAAGTSSTTFVTPANAALAANRAVNTRAATGALAFDGNTANAVATQDAAALAYGLDDFSHVIKTKRATYTPTAEVSLVEKAASNLGWRFRLTTGGYLKLQIGNGSNFTTYAYTSTVAVTATAYKTAIFAFTADRDGSVTFYENGVVLGAAVAMSGSAAQTATSTGTLRIGYDATTSDACILFCHTPYNLCLAQTDIAEICELGGAVPERFKTPYNGRYYWASQVPLAKTLTLNTWTAGSVVGNVITASTASTGFISGGIVAAAGFTPGRYRFAYDLTLNSGSAPALGDGNAYQTARMTAGAGQVLDFTTLGYGNSLLYVNGFATGDFILTVTSVTRIGAVCHYDADQGGCGFQLPDDGANKLHALLTTNSPTWTKQVTMGYVKVLSDGTTSAQALGSGTILPANCQIIRVRARSISGTPSITLGTSSGGSQIVASVALSTTWKDLTLALTGGINTAAASLWMTASAANVVEVQLAYEQLPA